MKLTKMIAIGLKNNGSPILVGVNIAAGATACYLTGRAAVKAYKEIQKDPPKSKKELVKRTWKYFVIPAVAFGASAASAIGASKISAARQAAIASAAVISEKALDTVTEGVKETIGENKTKKIVDEALQKSADKVLPKEDEIIETGNGDTLIQDSVTGQWIRTDCEVIRAARNSANDIMNKDGAVDFNTFLEQAGYNYSAIGDEIGWMGYDNGLFDVDFVGGASPYKGEPYLIIKYSPRPVLMSWD